MCRGETCGWRRKNAPLSVTCIFYQFLGLFCIALLIRFSLIFYNGVILLCKCTVLHWYMARLFVKRTENFEYIIFNVNDIRQYHFQCVMISAFSPAYFSIDYWLTLYCEDLSGVLLFNEKYYGVDGAVWKVSITCCLQDTRNFYCAALTKIPPKPGQIGRGNRGERQRTI